MGLVSSRVGHLCVDLSHIELTGNQQQALLETVQAAVVGHLANVASSYKVVTISLSPNNGTRKEEEESAPQDTPGERPVPDQPSRDEPPPAESPER